MKLKRIVSAALAGVMALGLLIIPDVGNLNVSAADGETVELLYDGFVGATNSEDKKVYNIAETFNNGVNGEAIRITCTSATTKTPSNLMGVAGLLPHATKPGTDYNAGNQFLKGTGKIETLTITVPIYDWLAGIEHTKYSTADEAKIGTPAKDDIKTMSVYTVGATGAYVKDSVLKIEKVTPSEKPEATIYNGLSPNVYQGTATKKDVVFTAVELGKGRGNPEIKFSYVPRDNSAKTDAKQVFAYPRKLVDGVPTIFGSTVRVEIPAEKTAGWVYEKFGYCTYSYTYEEFVSAVANSDKINDEIYDFVFYQSNYVGYGIDGNFKVSLIGAVDLSSDTGIETLEGSPLTLMMDVLKADVANDINTLTVDVKPAAGATFKLFSDEAIPTEIEDNKMTLAVGLNTALLIVHAEDGTSHTYTVKVTRAEPDVEISLSDDSALELNEKVLSGTVDFDADTYVVNITPKNGETYKLFSDEACENELADNKMTLEVGENTAYLQVSSVLGTKTVLYTVNITREEADDTTPVDTDDTTPVDTDDTTPVDTDDTTPVDTDDTTPVDTDDTTPVVPGKSDDNNGDDKNPATGIVLVALPIALAAAGMTGAGIILKKKKR